MKTMAANESFLDRVHDATSVNEIIKIQALVRGQVVRKQMCEIRQLYEEIVCDIDGPEMEVVWSSDILSHPLVRRVKKVKSKVRDKFNLSASQRPRQIFAESSDEVVFAHDSVDKNTPKMVLGTRSMISTEVQTDFVAVGEVQHALIPDIDKNCKFQLPQKCEIITDASLGKQPLNALVGKQSAYTSLETQPANTSLLKQHINTSVEQKQMIYTETVCSESQTDEVHCISSFADRNSTLVSDNFQISNNDKSILDNHLNNGKSEVSFQKYASEYGSSKSTDDVLLPERLENVINLEQNLLPGTFSNMLDDAKHKLQKDNTTLDIRPGDVQMMDLPNDKDQLLKLKNTTAMELLWVLQAINSRKHYLRLREQLH